MIAIIPLLNTFPISRNNTTLNKTVGVFRNQRHEICFAVKAEGAILEHLNEAQDSRPRRFKFGNRLPNSFLIGKMCEPPNHRVDCVDATPGNKRRQKISDGFDLKAVMQHLMLPGIIFVKIQKSILPHDIGHGKKVKVQGVIADV